MGVVATYTTTACPGCCDDPCAAYPETFNFTVADFVSCGCVGNPGDPHTLVSVAGSNGSFTGLDRVPGQNYWRKEQFVAVFDTYSDDDCTELIDSTAVYYCAFLVCDPETGNLRFIYHGSVSGYPAAPDDPGFTAFSADPITVGIATPNTHTACGGLDPYGDGTVLIE